MTPRCMHAATRAFWSRRPCLARGVSATKGTSRAFWWRPACLASGVSAPKSASRSPRGRAPGSPHHPAGDSAAKAFWSRWPYLASGVSATKSAGRAGRIAPARPGAAVAAPSHNNGGAA